MGTTTEKTSEPMLLSAARDYLRDHHSILVSTQTIWNWTRSGKRGVKLAVMPGTTFNMVTAAGIDRFIADVTEKHTRRRTI